MTPVTPLVGAIALLVIWRHQANIRRILAGTEPRLGQKKDGESKP
jgi:glycerol-3-phosphate acyltransferase PlsY